MNRDPSSRSTDPAPRPPLLPFHWPLEFPEVIVNRGGFDAFIGNPPFAGKNGILATHGTLYIMMLQASFYGSHGYSDLCTYFFRRAFSLVCRCGLAGLIGTKSVAQGKARESGLGWIADNEGVIIRALTEVPWPGQASVLVCVPLVYKGTWHGLSIHNGISVSAISSTLEPIAEQTVHVLRCNSGKSTTGFLIYGRGFIITVEHAETLLGLDSRNRDVLFPLISVDDILYSRDLRPSQWIIDFKDMTEDEARQYTLCFQWVEKNVNPERLSCSRKDAQRFWWRLVGRASQFFDVADKLKLKKVLVNARISKHLVFAFADVGYGFDANINMFTLDSYSGFSVLQSAIHLTWADYRASSLKTRRRYTPTTCFDSFPFPPLDCKIPIRVNTESTLFTIGDLLYRQRTSMLQQELSGLTELYNLFHDDDCVSGPFRTIRDLHVEMDKAVAAAYGWIDLELGHGFHETKQGVRFTISEPARREVLQRMLKLNHERYAEEVQQGLHAKKRGAGTGKRGPGKTKQAPGEVRGLFD